jgi:hypothetical protein
MQAHMYSLTISDLLLFAHSIHVQSFMFNNTAGISAGAIVVEVNSTVQLSNTTLTNNTATGSHAGAILVRGNLTVDSCMFDGNAASRSFGKGGAIAAEDFTANIAVTNSTFKNCGAYMGGAISCHGILDIKQVRNDGIIYVVYSAAVQC